MSMPTPSDHRLPNQPPNHTSNPAPQINQSASKASSVLERLKAAQPRTAPSVKSQPDDAGALTGAETRPGAGTGSEARSGPDGEADDKRSPRTPTAAASPVTAKLKSATVAASGVAARSGKQTTSWAVSTGRSAVASVRSWRADQIRRNLVTLTVIGTLVGTAAVVGLFGGPRIQDSELLSPTLTSVAPSLFSLYIWALIGLGMIGYTVHQWLTAEIDSPRHRGLGWVVIAALMLNLGVALAIQSQDYVLSLVLHGLLLAVLLGSLRWLNRWSAATRLEGALVDVPLGLFLGWTGFTALSHTAAVATLENFHWLTDDNLVWTMIGLGVVVVVGSIICSLDRGRIAVALALVWGFAWIIVERLIGQPHSLAIAGITALASFLLLITAGSRRHRVDHSYRRDLRARQTANLPPIDLADEEFAEDDYVYSDETDTNQDERFRA